MVEQSTTNSSTGNAQKQLANFTTQLTYILNELLVNLVENQIQAQVNFGILNYLDQFR